MSPTQKKTKTKAKSKLKSTPTQSPKTKFKNLKRKGLFLLRGKNNVQIICLNGTTFIWTYFKHKLNIYEWFFKFHYYSYHARFKIIRKTLLLVSVAKHLAQKRNMTRQKLKVYQENLMDFFPVYNVTSPISKREMYYCIYSLSMFAKNILATCVSSRHHIHQIWCDM